MEILKNLTNQFYEYTENGLFKEFKMHDFAKLEGGGKFFGLISPKDLFDNEVIL